uniref:Uncharacterized protein n=1 Tax=Timema shepardi TaxID=629360 RepID=A0A7R9AWR7_TIMSH|nr:unnamed protein product [Timema shepardi]
MRFVIQFSFLAAFFWLNVMCIDITWTFSRLGAERVSGEASLTSSLAGRLELSVTTEQLAVVIPPFNSLHYPSLKYVIVQTDDLTCIVGSTDNIQVFDVRFHRRLFEINYIS